MECEFLNYLLEKNTHLYIDDYVAYSMPNNKWSIRLDTGFGETIAKNLNSEEMITFIKDRLESENFIYNVSELE